MPTAPPPPQAVSESVSGGCFDLFPPEGGGGEINRSLIAVMKCLIECKMGEVGRQQKEGRTITESREAIQTGKEDNIRKERRKKWKKGKEKIDGEKKRRHWTRGKVGRQQKRDGSEKERKHQVEN